MLLLESEVLSRKSTSQLIVLQSSSCQSTLPILVNLLASTKTIPVHLLCVLYPPSNLVQVPLPSDDIQVHDFVDNVPGYSLQYSDALQTLIESIEATQGPIEVIIDSLDTLVSDTGSNTETYKSLNKLMAIINARPRPSRLIVHANAPSNLLSMLTQVQFSPSLTHVMAHPPIILTHLASAYLTPPPPLSPEAKFWSVFLPFSLRRYETDNLVYGPDGEGSGGLDEMVVEILSRSGGTSRRRGVERALEGWNLLKNVPQGLNELSSLRTLFAPQKSIEIAPDPTQNVSFNLNLTPSQQVSRAQVPLPYAHVGDNTSQKAAIFYDPDSADDMDDDDPDEDLDI